MGPLQFYKAHQKTFQNPGNLPGGPSRVSAIIQLPDEHEYELFCLSMRPMSSPIKVVQLSHSLHHRDVFLL